MDDHRHDREQRDVAVDGLHDEARHPPAGSPAEGEDAEHGRDGEQDQRDDTGAAVEVPEEGPFDHDALLAGRQARRGPLAGGDERAVGAGSSRAATPSFGRATRVRRRRAPRPLSRRCWRRRRTVRWRSRSATARRPDLRSAGRAGGGVRRRGGSSGGPGCWRSRAPRPRRRRPAGRRRPGASEIATCHGPPSGAAIRTSPPTLDQRRLAEVVLDGGGDQVGRPRLARGAEVEGGVRRNPDRRRRGRVRMSRQASSEGASAPRRVAREQGLDRRREPAEVPVVAQLHQGPAEQRVDQPGRGLGGPAGDLRPPPPAAGRPRPRCRPPRSRAQRSESSRKRLQVASTSATTHSASSTAADEGDRADVRPGTGRSRRPRAGRGSASRSRPAARRGGCRARRS